MKETIRNLKRVYSYGKEYRKNMFIFCFLSLIFIFVNVIYPILTAKQLTSLTGGLYKELITVTLIILGFYILSAIKTIIIKKNTQVFFRGTFKKIQTAVSKEILKIKVADIDKNSSGVFIERLNADCSELSHIFTIGVGHLTGLLTNIGVFIAVFIINKWAFLYYLFCSVVVTVIYVVKVKAFNERDLALRKEREKNIGLTSELVRGVRDIKMLNAKDSFIKEIEESIERVTKKNFDLRNSEMKYNLIIKIISAILETILIFLLILLISLNNITIPIAVVIYSYKDNIMTNFMEKVGDILSVIKTFNLSSKRVFGIFGESEFGKEKFGKVHLDHVDGNFEFKNVTFGYNEKDILKNLSFKVKANETVGFVGKSGAGKTTIFNLLCKMYDIDKGTITIDGVDINTLDEDSIRGNITIISQNPYIFNLSIKDNLKLVSNNITDEEMVEACKMACLDDFIKTLPNGYDTIVGEGGVTLSGGQKQRLAIARAFIQKTQIILFDEATSALDNETQSKIQTAINNLQKDYTILIIAHRLSTIVNCDKIMILDDGKIIDSGTHKELLKKNKEYKKLCETELVEK